MVSLPGQRAHPARADAHGAAIPPRVVLAAGASRPQHATVLRAFTLIGVIRAAAQNPIPSAVVGSNAVATSRESCQLLLPPGLLPISEPTLAANADGNTRHCVPLKRRVHTTSNGCECHSAAEEGRESCHAKTAST